jgi:CheY-specific phosphatase CheX
MTRIFETSTHEAVTTQVVQEVFQTMLQYDIRESAEDYSTRTNIVTSAIFFAGDWKGSVVVECSEEQARLFTGRLIGIDTPARMDDDTRDAMGEVVNMIGGNLKSVFPPGVSLSMPSVLEGPDYAYRICGSNRTERFAFRGEAGPLWVTLVQVNEEGE